MLNTEQFIERAHSIHGTTYDYTLCKYTKSTVPVTIICPEHGQFEQQPIIHTFNKAGCPKCSNKRKGAYHKKDTNWFVQEAVKIHGLKYSYQKVAYHRYHDKVEIICPTHGSFCQTPGAHIFQKQGCPTCSYQDYEGGYGKQRFVSHPEIKDRPAMLYVIKCTGNDERFIKIGITQHSLDHRFRKTNTIPYAYETVDIVSGTLYQMFKYEQNLKRLFKAYKYKPQLKFNGHTECLIVDCEASLYEALNTLKELP
jgi:hypothetical protein